MGAPTHPQLVSLRMRINSLLCKLIYSEEEKGTGSTWGPGGDFQKLKNDSV